MIGRKDHWVFKGHYMSLVEQVKEVMLLEKGEDEVATYQIRMYMLIYRF